MTETDAYLDGRLGVLAARAGADPAVHGRVAELIAIGKEIGADAGLITSAVEAYLEEAADWNFALQQKRLLCRAWGLPEAAVNSPLTTGDILDLVGNLHTVANEKEAMAVVQDPKTWQLIKLRGRGGKREAEQIIGQVWATSLGVPPDTAFRLDIKQLGEAAVALQQWGMEGAISRSEFWDDFLGSSDKLGTMKKWRARTDEEERIAKVESDRETRRRIAELARGWAAREREWEALQKESDEEKRRKIIKKKRKKRRRRGTVEVDYSEASIDRLVATPWGNNFVLRSYMDGSSELIRVKEDGSWAVALARGRHGYLQSRTSGGQLHVTPVIGRRASTSDRPEGQGRGPIGMQ